MAKKRTRTPKAKPGQLIAYYGKLDRHNTIPDFCFASGDGCDRSDRRLLNNVLNEAFTDELVKRGYDMTTFRFSVSLKSAS